MEKLKRIIETRAEVISESILKVDSFLNHQIDYNLMDDIGEEFYNYFKDKRVDRVLTIEASGIAIGMATAKFFQKPFVFAKKKKPSTMLGKVLSTDVTSFTKNIDYAISLSSEFINQNENVLIVDDFLARGNAASGLCDLVKKAGATIAGIGIVIEKSFQPGRKMLLEHGYDICSLVRIKSLNNNKISFY
ncbi:MAG: xanthine phosphoribosyltransferase [Desulfobacteraceae bacterium]|nr:xanthine phosphoribosyltransferase [Desulfobacteraceae bacterium]